MHTYLLILVLEKCSEYDCLHNAPDWWIRTQRAQQHLKTVVYEDTFTNEAAMTDFLDEVSKWLNVEFVSFHGVDNNNIYVYQEV